MLNHATNRVRLKSCVVKHGLVKILENDYKRSIMKIVCSWCRKEGKAEFVGEKAPFDDARETHGICISHRHEVETHWQASIHTAARSGSATGWSSTLFRWTGLLNVTKKMRP